jgi:ribosomal protein S18 acetylase RimI-like enzyme
VELAPSHFATLQTTDPDYILARSQILALLEEVRRKGVPDVFAEQAPDRDPSTLLVGAVSEVCLALLKGWTLEALRVWEAGIAAGSAEEGRDGKGGRIRDAAIERAEARDAAIRREKLADGMQQSAVDASAQNANDTNVVSMHTVPYAKFLFSNSSTSSVAAVVANQPLPQGLVYTTVRASEFALVRSRTSIPRKDRTLALLPSAGIRLDGADADTLIAWAFLGPDGSLSTLHVEPEYRKRGLGKALTLRVFGLLGDGADGKAGFEDVQDQEKWCHSDVSRDNRESTAVAKGLGGREGWVCYWVLVDLKRCSNLLV